MDGFPTVLVGGTEIVLDQSRPVAAVITLDNEVRFATWPDLPIGRVEAEPLLLPAPDSAWVSYPPATVSLMDDSHDALLLERDSPAVQVRPDGTIAVVRTGDRLAIGATTGLLWTAPFRHQLIDDNYRGDPMPVDWEEPTLLTATSPNGSTVELRVDRYVKAVFEESDLIHFVFAPTPPIAVPDGHGGFSYEYRISELTLPVAGPFPTAVRFLDHHSDGVGPAVAPRRCWWSPHAWEMPPAPARTIDLTDVPGSRWALTAELTTEQISEAIAAGRNWFGDLDEYWISEDGTSGPLASGMRDAEVHIEGECPATRAVITFRHRGTSHSPARETQCSLRRADWSRASSGRNSIVRRCHRLRRCSVR